MDEESEIGASPSAFLRQSCIISVERSINILIAFILIAIKEMSVLNDLSTEIM